LCAAFWDCVPPGVGVEGGEVVLKWEKDMTARIGCGLATKRIAHAVLGPRFL